MFARGSGLAQHALDLELDLDLVAHDHAAETSVEYLVEHHLPLLLQTAGEISADFARLDTVPHVTVTAS